MIVKKTLSTDLQRQWLRLNVHKWLDEYAKKYSPFTHLEYHRKFRHHAKGVQEVKEKWGFYAEQAAKLHIIRDNEMYLLMPVIDIMREDQIDELYEGVLKFCHGYNTT